MEIVKCKGRPFLLAGGIESAISVLSNCPHHIVIAISAGLPFLPEAFGSSRLISIGLHDLVPANAVRAWRSSGAHFVPVIGPEDFDKRLSDVIGAMEKGARAVLLLDVGVVDTGYAAATSSVNVGGLAAIDVVDAVETISRHLCIVGFASVGLNADLDPRGHTELMVAAAVDAASDPAAGS
ncbi:MAG: arginase family protein [Tagaea sp.]